MAVLTARGDSYARGGPSLLAPAPRLVGRKGMSQARAYHQQTKVGPTWGMFQWELSQFKMLTLKAQIRKPPAIHQYDVLPRNMTNHKLSSLIVNATTPKDIYWILRLHGDVLNHVHIAALYARLDTLEELCYKQRQTQTVQFLRGQLTRLLEATAKFMPPEQLATLAENVTRQGVHRSRVIAPLAAAAAAAKPGKFASRDLGRVIVAMGTAGYVDWDTLATLAQNYAAQARNFDLAQSRDVCETVRVIAALSRFLPYVWVPVDVPGDSVDRADVSIHLQLHDGSVDTCTLPYLPAFFVNKAWVPQYSTVLLTVHVLADLALDAIRDLGRAGAAGAERGSVHVQVLVSLISSLVNMDALQPGAALALRELLADVALADVDPVLVSQLYLSHLVFVMCAEAKGVPRHVAACDASFLAPNQAAQAARISWLMSGMYRMQPWLQQVLASMHELRLPHVTQARVGAYPRRVDALVSGVGGKSVCVQADGRGKVAIDELSTPLSVTIREHQLLLAQGVPVVRIGGWEWEGVGVGRLERQRFVLQKMKHALQLR